MQDFERRPSKILLSFLLVICILTTSCVPARVATYDSANRLKSITGASTATFSYNGFGDRLTQNGVNYTLDLNTGLTQVLADGTNTYLYGLGRIAERQGTSSEYYLGDALGSVRQIANGSGSVTLARNYDPYGKTAQSIGTAQTDYGFTGEFTDASGLIYLRARYYQSLTGRFTSRDSFEGNVNSPASLNRFNYAHSNPVMNTDSSGHCVFAVVDTILCALIGGTVGAVIGAGTGTLVAGGLAAWIWDTAKQGKCGCADTMQILAIPRQQFIGKAMQQGAIWGAVLGFVAGTGPLGGVAASLVGMGASTVQLMQAATQLRDNLQDKCAWIQFGASMAGLFISAGFTAGSYNFGVSSGQWVGWGLTPEFFYNKAVQNPAASETLIGKFFEDSPLSYNKQAESLGLRHLNLKGVFYEMFKGIFGDKAWWELINEPFTRATAQEGKPVLLSTDPVEIRRLSPTSNLFKEFNLLRSLGYKEPVLDSSRNLWIMFFGGKK